MCRLETNRLCSTIRSSGILVGHEGQLQTCDDQTPAPTMGKGDGHKKINNFRIMESEKKVSYLFMAVPVSLPKKQGKDAEEGLTMLLQRSAKKRAR